MLGVLRGFIFSVDSAAEPKNNPWKICRYTKVLLHFFYIAFTTYKMYWWDYKPVWKVRYFLLETFCKRDDSSFTFSNG